MFAVKSSKPEPPDAKHTPVGRSCGVKDGFKYAGNVSFTPKAEATQIN
jgi:hypothetical protein